MDMEFWQANWNKLGADDPLWVVLTDPSKKGGKWDPASFFQTGRDEVKESLSKLTSRGTLVRRGRALDFGCGVGRLSQALSEEFEEVHGVDISPSMIGHATRFNRFPGKCNYHVNNKSDLTLFPDNHFDFVFTMITLQHIEAPYALAYIQDFIRVLKPGGILNFQVLIPSFWRSLVPDFAVNAYRRWRHGSKAFIGMFGLSKSEVDGVIARAGGKVLHFEINPSDHPRWRALHYVVTKPG